MHQQTDVRLAGGWIQTLTCLRNFLAAFSSCFSSSSRFPFFALSRLLFLLFLCFC